MQNILTILKINNSFKDAKAFRNIGTAAELDVRNLQNI